MQTGKAISIPSILKVGNGTLNKIGEYLKSEELTSVVIFMGKRSHRYVWRYHNEVAY